MGAVFGGAAGIAVSIGIGVGIYFGGLKLNLGRFFRITGLFLVLIAAGLVMSTLRTAHEAGWMTIGQQQVFDFSSWMPRSVLGALITGMFGIPSDPRLIEVLGWLLYAVPVLVVFLWPAGCRGAAARRRLLAATGGGAGRRRTGARDAGARRGRRRRADADRDRAGGHTATVTWLPGSTARRLTVAPAVADPARRRPATNRGRRAGHVWQAKGRADPGISAATATLAQSPNLTGGRLPVGLGRPNPGPFEATGGRPRRTRWRPRRFAGERAGGSNRIAVLTGGGLTAPKTVSLGGLAPTGPRRAEDQRSRRRSPRTGPGRARAVEGVASVSPGRLAAVARPSPRAGRPQPQMKGKESGSW